MAKESGHFLSERRAVAKEDRAIAEKQQAVAKEDRAVEGEQQTAAEERLDFCLHPLVPTLRVETPPLALLRPRFR